MLVFPHWRQELPNGGCRVQGWMPAERFAPYLARPMPATPIPAPPLPPQLEDEDSSGGSSPEREGESPEGVCGWRGCSAAFQSVARLSAHVARNHAHAHADGLFYCGWRGCARPQRGFNARYKMLVHVRTHTNERPHTCNQCHKSFSRAENLKIHLRSHSGEKPYVCPYEGCGKAYSNSSDRFKHTRTHAVEKPYCCKIPGCNKRYTDPSSLRKHVKTYKHFTTEQLRRESSDSETFSPKENTERLANTSSIHARLVYPPSISPVDTPVRYAPIEQVTYIRPKPMYPIRVPTNEMSYSEYSQMYEKTYRSYYSNMSYPVLRPTVSEKFTHEERIERMSYVSHIEQPDEEMPLNLCSKRLECRPIEDLVRRTDLPLDLSTKS